MGVGAIVVVDAGNVGSERGNTTATESVQAGGRHKLADRPLAFLEVLGRSALERTIEQLSASVDTVSVLVHWDVFSAMPPLRGSFDNVSIMAAIDLGLQFALTLKAFTEKGIDHAFVVQPTMYCEADLAEMSELHRDGQCAITCAVDSEGPLDLWIMDCDAKWEPSNSSWCDGILDGGLRKNSYFVRQYSKRIAGPEDLRSLAIDAFTGQSQMSPSGKEVRPGVWIDDGAQIHRGASVNGPAFLGRGCTVRENALISQFSNIESCSYVDCGTCVEESTILPNTYVGIGLDVRNSIVLANRVLNLTRDVVIEVSDPDMFRSTSAEGKAGAAKLALMNFLHLTGFIGQAADNDIPEHEVQPAECFTNMQNVNVQTEFES